MPASQKIITKLRERRQIEADLRKMLAASSESEFRRRAQRIASSGSQVIPTIVGNLDQADARMLAAMGTVATFLSHDEVAIALRQAVLQPHQTDRGRLGAMTILERFLGQPPDDDLLTTLRNPEGEAIASLEEMLDQVEGNPSILIQYVEELDRQEPDIVLAVARSLRDLGIQATSLEQRQRAVEPLRMMAQDVRDEIAAEALVSLGAIRLPEAAQALQTLTPITVPELRPVVERLLRKLQFSGVEVNRLPLPDPDWRALVSPLNGLGQQSVWFIQETRSTAQAQILNVLLSDRAGALEAVGHTQVPALLLPPRKPLGHLHDIALPDGSGGMLMLEASFDLGRRLVVEALPQNWETQIPVAGPLRLLSPWLWGYAGADSLPLRVLPEVSAEEDGLVANSDHLLEHPAFVTWSARSEATFQAAEEIMRHPGWKVDTWVNRLTGELFAGPLVAQMLHKRLMAMSEWLLLADDESRARQALVAAKAILEGPLQDQPLLQAVVRRDLEQALASLQESEPVSGMEQYQ
jgi:hypothetical protein